MSDINSKAEGAHGESDSLWSKSGIANEDNHLKPGIADRVVKVARANTTVSDIVNLVFLAFKEVGSSLLRSFQSKHNKTERGSKVEDSK